MTRKPDPKAERIKARKERKSALRRAFRDEGPVGAVKLFLKTKIEDCAIHLADTEAECDVCLAQQRKRAPAA